MPFVIGLVGEKGSGKGTFVEMFQTVAAPTVVAGVRFSDVLRDTLTLWDVPETRAHLQDLAAIMVHQYGPDTLAHAVEERIRCTHADIVILDGIRWEADAMLLERFPAHLLVYITADPQARFDRLRARGENVGDAHATFEQFMGEERAVTEITIPRIGARADVCIVNNGTLAEYRAYVVAVCAQATVPSR